MTTRETEWGAVVVAAGSGSRFGSPVPKQFLKLGDRTVTDWSVSAFLRTEAVREVVVVTPPDEELWRPWWRPPAGVATVPGGSRRQDSVMAGLKALTSCGRVLVHDAARPLVSPELIVRVMRGVEEAGAAVPVIPVRDTVKRVSAEGTVSTTLSRDDLMLSQTPQGFDLDLLLDVLGRTGDVTDECAAMEAAGIRVLAVKGDPVNMKLTDPDDLAVLGAMAGGTVESRTGIGIDFHPFRAGIPLVLGGCSIPSDKGLQGHSDGDAVLHAIADALLSAARMGDIGVHFPPDDGKWKNADSSVILEKTAGMLRDRGWEFKQLDITVIAGFPKVSPIRDEMISRVARILKVGLGRIWIKGTTTNTLGDIGKGKGLGCMAVAVISRKVPPGPEN